MVELSLTLMIIGIFLMLTAPAFTHWKDRLDHHFILEGVAADLRYAQQHAHLLENESIFQVKNNTYRVKQQGRILRQERVKAPYSLRSNYPNNQVIFRKTGQVRGGQVTLWQGGEKVGSVIIQVASGQVRVEREP